MNILSRPENLAEDASRFAAMRAPVLWTAGALFNVLAWGRIIFHERDIGRRLDDDIEPRLNTVEQNQLAIEPRLNTVEQNQLAIEPRVAALEARNHDGRYEEYNIELDNKSRITGMRRYCTAEEIQKVVKFTPKSCTLTVGSSRNPEVPRRSGRLQEREERDGEGNLLLRNELE
ncbi:hypothetical protein DL95DRAFT_390895 [Leptodontidium sp. 2 PMI_412]|nr:hypothetical protein DL95DRAFT_390895 [Leptodontidium sp. 2 PMI_412]